VTTCISLPRVVSTQSLHQYTESPHGVRSQPALSVRAAFCAWDTLGVQAQRAARAVEIARSAEAQSLRPRRQIGGASSITGRRVVGNQRPRAEGGDTQNDAGARVNPLCRRKSATVHMSLQDAGLKTRA
jgi:hypothetical protein